MSTFGNDATADDSMDIDQAAAPVASPKAGGKRKHDSLNQPQFRRHALSSAGGTWPSPPRSPSGQQAGSVAAAQKAAAIAALAFLEQPVPENADPSEAKKLEKTLDDAGLDCKTKERCVQVPADYAKEHIVKLRNLAQLYRRYVTSIKRQEDYPPLYLRYDIPDQAVVPLEWMVAQMDIWLLQIAHPSALSTSKFATMPGFIVQIDPDKELLLASPDSWIFRFRPLNRGNPAPHPGPIKFDAPSSVWHPYYYAKPGPVSKWEIHGSSDIVDMYGKPSEDPRYFAEFLLRLKDPAPDRGLWAYVQLAKGCDYKGVLSWGDTKWRKPPARTAWEDWVRAEAKRNEEPFEG